MYGIECSRTLGGGFAGVDVVGQVIGGDGEVRSVNPGLIVTGKEFMIRLTSRRIGAIYELRYVAVGEQLGRAGC